MQPPVPGVEVTDDADRACRRRPDRECGASDALVIADVSAELLVDLLVAALADQVQVELTERQRERIGILDRERSGSAIVDLELVVQRQLLAFEKPFKHATGVDLR